MRLGIDNISTGASTLPVGPGGMRMYLLEMIAGIAVARPEWELVVFTPRGSPPLLEALPKNVTVAELPYVPINRGLRAIYQQLALPWFLRKRKIDALFATATVAPVGTRATVVLAVQFLQFLMPQSGHSIRNVYLRIMLRASLRKAKRVIAFSRSAMGDLKAATSIADDKIVVVPHGIADEVWELTRNPTAAAGVGLRLTGGRPYILYVSATYDYKNHVRLIRAFARVKRELRPPHVLLLVGSEVTVSFAELRAEAHRQQIDDDVVIAGRVPSAAAVYFDATATVFPSLRETFGFPALEAMACGCPVVTSNMSSMVELAAGAAVLVDPFNEDSIASGIKSVLIEPNLREQLVVRGKAVAAQYTWANAAAATAGVIDEAVRM